MINKMKKAYIHQSPAEKLANTSASTITAIERNTEAVTRAIREIPQEDNTAELSALSTLSSKLDVNKQSIDILRDYIDHPEMVVRKLNEIKSADIITNQILKEIRDNSDIQTLELDIKGISMITLEGKKGDTPKVDTSKIEKLLSRIIENTEKQKDITISLELV
jgi:hypothetical protein